MQPSAVTSTAQAPLILVVEDNPVTRKSVRVALEVEGYRVAEAGDGGGALHQMRVEVPDLVLLDLLLPDIHGADVLAQMRALPGGADIPILAFSGFVSKMEEARIAGAGFTDFLLKPIEPSHLVRTVARFLVPRATTSKMPGAGRRLLLADDDPVQLKYLRLQFEHVGFQVQIAHDGAEALNKAQQDPPNLIVTDILMPHMDGFDLCLAVRNEPRLRNVPLVMVSANYVEAADQQLAVRVGCSGFVQREQGFDQLLRTALDSLEQPAPAAVTNVHDIKTERHTQIVHQLERQVILHAASAQRNAVQSAILHELGLIADTLAKRKDLESALDEILAHCLDRAGLSKGALYLTGADASLALRAHYGCAKILDSARAFFAVPDIFQQALRTGDATMIPSVDVPSAQAEQSELFLRQAQAKSALIIPVRSGEKDAAVLLLLSTSRNLRDDDWLAFGRALAAQIGQSVALSRTFYRLAESEQRYRSLFEAANDGIALTDDDGRVMDANPAACALAGYPIEQFRGMNVDRVLTGLDRERWPEILREYRRTGALKGEFTYTMRSGTVKTVEVHGTRVSPGMYLNIVLDVTERRHAERLIHDLAYRDTLTGLPNRTALQERLVHGLIEARTKEYTLALLVLNLSNFREINETLGHGNGDQVLLQVAERLKSIFWESDVVARLAGDEFALLLPRLTERSHIERVVDKIAQGFRPPFKTAEVLIDVQINVGVVFYPEHGVDADTLFRRADVALHDAKDMHLLYSIYDPAKDRTDAKQLALIAELREAIQVDQLLLYYQPKILAQTGRVIGMEALVRWPHATRGMIFPDDFVPMAERTGLINPLTTWVVGNALRQTRLWCEATQQICIAVNLSARNFQQSDLVTEIRDLVHGSGVPPSALTLEVTESAVMVEPKRALAILGELRAFGVRISIDDFGIGHSSLAYLKLLPVDQLKIDKSFVMNFKDKGNAAIVRSTIELAHNLGLEVTAEGVEDELTLDALRTLGCDVAQGYHIGRPMPVSDVAPWLARWKPATPNVGS